jgi:hypothetical protein
MLQLKLQAIRNDPAKLQALAQQADPNPMLAQMDAQQGALPAYYSADNTAPDAASPVNPAAATNPNIGALLMGANALQGPRPTPLQLPQVAAAPHLGAMNPAKFTPNPYSTPQPPNIGRLLLGR